MNSLSDPSFDLDLVIVGMPGWCADDVIARLEGLKGFGSRVLWFKRMSDAGLSWLYEHCHVSLFPSLYEGWGLPVVEALQHGRPVIASNRGATPEAGLGLATILDPDDRAGWRAAVIAASRAPRQFINVEPERFPDWDSTVATVKRGILGCNAKPILLHDQNSADHDLSDPISSTRWAAPRSPYCADSEKNQVTYWTVCLCSATRFIRGAVKIRPLTSIRREQSDVSEMCRRCWT